MKRRGFVLGAALLVVVLIAVLVAGVFFATMEESHIASTAAARDLALTAAESAIQARIDTWGGATTQSIGVAGEELSTFSRGNITVDVSITRLDSAVYSVVAQARSLSSMNAATRRIGVIVSAQNPTGHSILVDPIPERWWWELL